MTDAERLRQQYRTSLNRDASDAEIAGWTSGRFGGGGVADWERQIAGSHEAQQRPTYRAPLSQQAAPGVGYATPRSQPTSFGLPQSRPPQHVAATDPWNAFTSQDHSGQSYEDTIKKAYKRWTGREADPAGLQAHLNNPYGLEGALRAIYESEESQKYGQANPEAWRGIAPPGTVPPVVPGATTPVAVQPQIFQGFTPRYAMEGFDFAREQNTGKSAKDAFAFLSNQAPPPPINNKAALGEWFKKNVAPGMDALGHKIISIDGDKFTFENWQGRFTVDFGRGAGAEGGALAWQVDDATAQMANGPYVPQRQSAAPVIDPVTGAPAVVPPPDETAPVVTRQSTANEPLSNTTRYRRRQYRRFDNANSGGGSEYAPPQPSI